MLRIDRIVVDADAVAAAALTAAIATIAIRRHDHLFMAFIY